MKTVLISGGTGLIGKNLTQKLKPADYEIRILSRQKAAGHYYWNPDKNEADESAFENLDAIIHLTGADISKRWTKSYKKALYDSRINTAKLLLDYVQKTNSPVECFISASGVNYYGTETTDHIFTEEEPGSDDFLGKLCADWEAAAFDFEKTGIRVCVVRTPVVLSPGGGMLKKLIPVAKLSLISALGSGKQIVPWIHIDDLTAIYIRLLEDPGLSGVYNAAASQIVNSDEFTKSFARSMGKKVIMPRVHGFMLRLVFGEMASVMLKGSAVSNRKIKDTGFRFRFDNLDDALRDLIK